MNVTPSTKTDLLDVTFDSDGNMLDSNGNYVEDNDSITSSGTIRHLPPKAVPVLTALDQTIPDQTAQTHLMTSKPCLNCRREYATRLMQ